MRGTGQPLCSQTRTATCALHAPALELWLLLQLNTLLRVPYCACTFDPQIRLLGWSPRTKVSSTDMLRRRTWFLHPTARRRAGPSEHC